MLVGRRAFADFHLMTILEEARRSLIVIEHDPLLYEDVIISLPTDPPCESFAKMSSLVTGGYHL
jgi:hypothetical protein